MYISILHNILKNDGENPVSVDGTTDISDKFHCPAITLNWTTASPVNVELKLWVTLLKCFFSELMSWFVCDPADGDVTCSVFPALRF